MRLPSPRNWLAEDLAADLISAPTPPALLTLLVQAVMWPEDAATVPYCGTAQIFDSISSAASYSRYLAAVVAPAAVHGRAAITRGWTYGSGTTTPASYHELWSSTGGTTGNDVTRVHLPGKLLAVLGFAGGGLVDIAVSGDEQDDTPTAPVDRLLELATVGAPYVESLYVTKCAGYSLAVSEQLADLETL